MSFSDRMHPSRLVFAVGVCNRSEIFDAGRGRNGSSPDAASSGRPFSPGLLRRSWAAYYWLLPSQSQNSLSGWCYSSCRWA